ncbi:MAG: type II toxin-antitoxin system HicA family toxin [Chitinispirillaceae bacterium]|nr:type II toxin-antitoxin system HicA family toxin [Chitinispirillaceae bacterium]
MKAVSGKEFARLLEKRGWKSKRINGSHHVYCKPGNPARITVPIHGSAALKVGLQRHLMKNAGIGESEL